ncbi:MAG: DegT/DnrJ/EryC1/StrS family aminotransferase [Promethearchaeota archaeon]
MSMGKKKDNNKKKEHKKKKDILKWPVVPERAKKRVMDLLDKGEISISSEVDKFNDAFKKYIGVKYSIPECNGTAALYSAFFAIGVGPGDEVITPSYTYWATAMPASVLGAKIIFAESNPKTFNIDPEDVKKKITPKTKAIVPVHLWGLPCEMDELREVADEHNIYIIEDASHAHGAEYKGKKIGTLGDIACFSLQGSKLLPAGEGGFMVTNNKEFYEKGVTLGHYERIKKLSDRYNKYERTGFGFKFRMSPLHAAIGRSLLETYDKYNEEITRAALKVRRAIGELKGFINYEPPSYIKRVYYENLMDYDEKISGVPREKLLSKVKLALLNVSATRYPLLHQQTYFVERGSDPHGLPVTEALVSRLFRFPSYKGYDEEVIDEFIEKFKRFYTKAASH